MGSQGHLEILGVRNILSPSKMNMRESEHGDVEVYMVCA
jgi:hypothetical protein